MNNSSPEILARIREEIDAIDTQLVGLLNKRAELALQAGASKGNSVKFRPTREASIMARIKKINPGPLKNETLVAVMREVISGCLNLEQTLRVGFLDAENYGEQAARSRFGVMAEYVAASSTEDALEKVERGEIDVAVLALEGVAGDSQDETSELLSKFNLSACDEIRFPLRDQHVIRFIVVVNQDTDNAKAGAVDFAAKKSAAPKNYILNLNPYQPSVPLNHVARQFDLQPEDIAQLASNENPIAPSSQVIEAVRRALKGASRYPDQLDLISSIAGFCHVSPARVAIGNGSNDILDMIARVYLGEGDEAISSRYSFAVYKIATTTAGAENVVVDNKPDFNLDLRAILAAITPKTKVIWLDNPGNPTGAFTPYNDIRQFLNSTPKNIKVVLDEAYFEYLPDNDRQNAIEWLKDFPNLIIVRTFSKMYGLAGVRVGYATADTETIELMNRVRHPFNVNVLALVAAQAALQDRDFVEKSRQLNKRGRDELMASVKNLGLSCIKPYGNFVTVRVPNAQNVYQKLLEKGVVVRPLAAYGMADYLRISVGTKVQNQKLINALTEILS